MIKTRRENVLYENPWVQFRADEVEFPDGSVGEYAFAERVDAGPMIIPLLDDGRLVVLREWRYPIQDWTYCFPFGGVEAGEDALAAAKRELLEETGYSARDWVSLGNIKIDPGGNSQVTPVWLARGLELVDKPSDPREDHELVVFSLADLENLVTNGTIDNGWLLAGLCKYKVQKNMKRLYRSKTDRMIAGICGGLGEYWNVDPTLIRLGMVALLFVTGGGLAIAYIAGAIIIPEKSGV